MYKLPWVPAIIATLVVLTLLWIMYVEGIQKRAFTIPLPLIPAPTTQSTNSPTKKSGVCIQVITPARNPQTGECKQFSTPCDVPQGWNKVQSCSQTSTTCPTPPVCNGNLIYGDPAPTNPNQCPGYTCL